LTDDSADGMTVTSGDVVETASGALGGFQSATTKGLGMAVKAITGDAATDRVPVLLTTLLIAAVTLVVTV